MKALLSLVFLGVVVFYAIRIVPVYVENYEFQDYLNHAVVEASVHQPQKTSEALKSGIFAKAESLGLPVERQDIQVSVGQTVKINVDYSVSIDLKLYTVSLHFTPSAKNSNII